MCGSFQGAGAAIMTPSTPLAIRSGGIGRLIANEDGGRSVETEPLATSSTMSALDLGVPSIATKY